MYIDGLAGLTDEQIDQELQRGAKFITFSYTISILIVTFRRNSDVYFIRADESAFLKGMGYTLTTFFLGWWGIPWGPVYSIMSIATNLGGGKDITQEVLASIRQAAEAASPAPRSSPPPLPGQKATPPPLPQDLN